MRFCAQSSLLRIRRLTTDFEIAHAQMKQFWSETNLTIFEGRRFRSEVDALVLAKSSFSENATERGLSVSQLVVPDNHLIAIPITGKSHHIFNGGQHVASGMTAVFQPAGMELESRTLTRLRTLQVTINAEQFALGVRRYLGDETCKAFSFKPEIQLNSDYGNVICRLARQALMLKNQPPDHIDQPILIYQIFEERFFLSLIEYHAQSLSCFQRPSLPAPVYVLKAEEFIRANLQKPLSILDISIACNISGRSLMMAFKKHRGCSPMQFWRNQRLHAAREEIVKRPDLSISQIALRWGFSHFGRFAIDYAHHFQETPSETRRLLRLKKI